jgi:hypothetical protein
VTKNRLCDKSGFFKDFLRQPKRDEDYIYLREDDPDAFGIVIKWLDGELDSMSDEDGCGQDLVKLYIKAYVLADKLLMPMCKNSIVDEIRKYHTNYGMVVETLNDAVSLGLMPVHTLYRYLLDQYIAECQNGHVCHDWTSADTLCDLDETHRQIFNNTELASELLLASLKTFHFKCPAIQPGELPAEQEGCVYHDHDTLKEGNECRRQYSQT